MEMEAPTDGLLGLHVRLRVVEKHSRFVFVFVFLPFFLLRNSQFAIYNERFFSFTDNERFVYCTRELGLHSLRAVFKLLKF